MSTPDTASIRASYATVATYRQSPNPSREADFNDWLDQERQKAWEAGYQAREKWRQGQDEPEYPSRKRTR